MPSARGFLEEEMEDVCYVRFYDVLQRYKRLGGTYQQLKGAVSTGPYVFVRVGEELYIDHADGRTVDAYDRKVQRTAERLEGLFD